jgi:hypothetical protein
VRIGEDDGISHLPGLGLVMDTQSNWSSEDRYQASGQTPPAGVPDPTGSGGLVPSWSVPPGLLDVTRSAAWRDAHADALDEADDPANMPDEQYAWSADEQADQPADTRDAWPAHEQAGQPAHEQHAWSADEQHAWSVGEQYARPADEQAGQPADTRDAWPADEQDAWPGVAPPAGWFLHRPGESDPSPDPARDDPAASATEDAADEDSLAGEWFSPGDGPDADISEDEYDEYDGYAGAEDDDPPDAGVSPAAEGSQGPPGDLESNGPWPVLQPRAASQPRPSNPSPYRDPDGSWAQPATGATMALQGRAGQPRHTEPARASASPWQRSQRLWGEQWEHHPEATPQPAPAAPHVPHQEPSPRLPQRHSYAPQPHSYQAQPDQYPPQPHQYPPQPRQPQSYLPQPSLAPRSPAGRHIRSGPRPVEQPNASWPGNLRYPLSAPVYTEPELDTDETDAMDGRQATAAPPLWPRTPHQDSAARAGTRQSSDTMLLEPPMPDTGPTKVRRRRFRAATLALPVVVLVAVALLALALLTGHGPKLGPLESSQKGTTGTGAQQSGLVTATLGTYAGQQARGVFQTVNRVVSSGNTIVAVGAQASGGVARQQFFVSANGGASWQLAPVHALGGGQPALGYTAGLLAGGPGGWLAIGSQAIWTSPNGLTWTLAATHGIEPQLPGDQVWVVTRTADGYLAAGEAAAGGTTQAVIWTSPDGLTWHRTTGLTAPGARALNISYATWHGADTVIAGALSNGESGAWLSTNGGTSWIPVTIPADNGAGPAITGLGFDASGLIAVRSGRSPSGAQDGVSYFSPNGQAWQYAATIGATDGLSPRVVKGSAYGFVVTGTDGTGNLVAYTSAGTGTAWQPTASLGSAATEAVMGAAVAPAGTIVAIGSAAASNLGQQPVFLEADTAGSVRQVPLAGIPGATIPQLGVNGLAVADGQQIAVGSADGYPAIWQKAAAGSWTLVTPLSLASAAGPRLASLSSVAHGAEGWIAVGVPGPTVLTSTDGTTWQAATGPIARDLTGVAGVAVTAGPTGYVIVGKLVAKSGACVADVWYSPNLIDWTRAHDVNDATGSSQVLAVAAQPHGFLSVGSHNGQPAVWTTVNGSSWTTTLLPPPPGDTGGVLDQVAVNGSRVVAMGEQIAGNVTTPLVELSTDGGKSWAQLQLTSPGPNTVVTALTASGNGFAAAGQYGQPGQQDAAVWTSTSGVNWQVSDVIGPGVGGQNEIAALASSGTTVTGIGSIQTQQSQESIVLTLHAH